MRNYIILFLLLMVTTAIFSTACGDEKTIKYTRYFSDGSQLYKNYCENCHSVKGDGLAKLIPPLTDVDYLKKNRNKLPCIVVNGLSGNIIVHEQNYNFKMPASKTLAPIDVAKLLTYVTNSFGNEQGLYDITEVEKHLINCR